VYTSSMSILPHVTPAPAAKSKDITRIATFYAAVIVVMVVSQLFTFESFVLLFREYHLPVSAHLSTFLSALLVVCEVFALPFLLRMSLSPAFRVVSIVSGWGVAMLWLLITVWLVSTESMIGTVGFFGTVFDTMPGWWAVCISLVFCILAAWSSWGMWPGRRVVARKK